MLKDCKFTSFVQIARQKRLSERCRKESTYLLTISSMQTKTATCAISVDPDEKAGNEPSHPDLHYITKICLFKYIENFISKN